jgi:hypothetical protein
MQVDELHRAREPGDRVGDLELQTMAAAMLTADVVFPTPPFWFATVITRVSGGLGQRSR